MNERTEKKLTDLSGMNRAVNEILQQAWKRGRKYGNEEKKDVEERPTGEWIHRRVIAKDRSFNMVVCSNCRTEFSWDAETGVCMDNYKICPNCGADMRKGGRKYGNEEKKDVEERPIRGIARTDKNGEIKIELLRPQADEGAIEILTNYEKTVCHDCILRPCSVPCRLLTALRYAIKYMKGGAE